MKNALGSIITFLVLTSTQAHAILQTAYVWDLEVTQPCVGFYEVDEKAGKMEKMTESVRKEFIKNEPIPVVIGPKSRMYMVDHHHLAKAVIQIKHKTVYVEPFLDLSHLDIDSFWQEMTHRKLAYLKDNGKPIEYKDLPKNIEKLDNDDYRSLAGQVRKAGGYQKTTMPFAEFLWADFFRTRIKIRKGNRAFKQAIAEAVELAKSEYAKDLPGHLSKVKTLSCADVL